MEGELSVKVRPWNASNYPGDVRINLKGKREENTSRERETERGLGGGGESVHKDGTLSGVKFLTF